MLSESRPDVQEPSLLTVKDVAERLRVSEATVYRLAEDGELARVKVRGSTRFAPAAVDEYVQKASAR